MVCASTRAETAPGRTFRDTAAFSIFLVFRAGILDVVDPLLQRSTQEALSLRPLLFSESTKARLGMFFVARGIKVAKRRAAEYIFRDT